LSNPHEDPIGLVSEMFSFCKEQVTLKTLKNATDLEKAGESDCFHPAFLVSVRCG